MTQPAMLRRAGSFAGTAPQLWLTTLFRFGLGGVLVFASYRKLLDPFQAALAVQAYQIFPPRIGELVGYGLPLVELGLAVMLILGLGTRIAGWLTSGVMAAFIAGVISVWVRGLSIDCGCFGGGGAVAPGQADYLPIVLRDSAFLLMALFIALYPRSRWALDRSGKAGTHDEGLYDELDEPDPEELEAEMSHAADVLDDKAAADEAAATDREGT